MTPLWMRNVQTESSRAVLSQEWYAGEELTPREEAGANRALRGLVSRQLHHAEVFLCDQMPFHAKTKLVASRSGKDQ